MEELLEKFKEYLKRNNLKFTPSRELVLKEVFATRDHFNVDELYEKLCKKGLNISRATVYRTMPILVETKVIQRSLGSFNKNYYEYTYGHTHHDHLICTKCGRIIEFSEERIEKLQMGICKKYDFEPVEHRLSIKGLCIKCR
ncbi:MAG: Fur family transcriptional regulator [Candidatus Hydrogenedentota bacterium]